MKKSYTVDSTCNDMRIDRWLRFKVGKIPQGLIEKYLRTGKIKLNKKKVKSSHKIKTKDEVSIFNIEFKERIHQKKIKFIPTKEIIKMILMVFSTPIFDPTVIKIVISRIGIIIKIKNIIQ